MIRILALVLALAAMVLPSSALAAKAKPPVKAYKVGQVCTTKKQATYKAHHFTCVHGRLRAMKK